MSEYVFIFFFSTKIYAIIYDIKIPTADERLTKVLEKYIKKWQRKSLPMQDIIQYHYYNTKIKIQKVWELPIHFWPTSIGFSWYFLQYSIQKYINNWSDINEQIYIGFTTFQVGCILRILHRYNISWGYGIDTNGVYFCSAHSGNILVHTKKLYIQKNMKYKFPTLISAIDFDCTRVQMVDTIKNEYMCMLQSVLQCPYSNTAIDVSYEKSDTMSSEFLLQYTAGLGFVTGYAVGGGVLFPSFFKIFKYILDNVRCQDRECS